MPLVLVHTGDKDNGHFRTFRFKETLYKKNCDQPKQPKGAETMKDRLDNAMRSLGHYVEIKRDPLPLIDRREPMVELQLSGSIYEPSSGSSQESEGGATLVASSLTPDQYAMLHEHLNPHQRLRGDERDLWRIAERANRLELRRGDAPDARPGDRLPAVEAVSGALERRMGDPTTVVALMRRLPYPLVTLVTRPPRLRMRLGKELAMLGRSMRFKDWRAGLTEQEAKAFDELTSHDGQDTDERWIAAQSKESWQRMSALLARDIQQHRTLSASEEEQTFLMLVALVLSFPSDLPVPVLCDLAHNWISSNGADARQLLAELRCHKWAGVHAACSDILRQAFAPRQTQIDEEADR